MNFLIKRLRNSLKKINSFIKFGKMNDLNEPEEPVEKKQRLGSENEMKQFPYQKKKVAMLLVYSGKGYKGMQRNYPYKTIEGDLLQAFVNAGIIRPDHAEHPGAKMSFQRAARTDKGVSAAGQVVSLKMFVDVENALEKINLHLSPSMRVLGFVKVTKGFDSKNNCDSRTYSYLIPTFAFAPMPENVNEDYRITEDILNDIQEILTHFLGTHKFHNFTSGKDPNDPSAKRYIKEFKIGKPFVNDSIEYVPMIIRGQSFVIHQIRKMIGLTISMMRGYSNLRTLDKCWCPEKVNVPKAPGIGLVLEKVHYNSYNAKFGSDGIHEGLSWEKYEEEIEKFKNEHIYPIIFHEEKIEKSMLKWLSTLPVHYDNMVPDLGRNILTRSMGLAQLPKEALPISNNQNSSCQSNSMDVVHHNINNTDNKEIIEYVDNINGNEELIKEKNT